MKKTLLAIAMAYSLCGVAVAEDALQYDIQVVRSNGGTIKEMQHVSLSTKMGQQVPIVIGETTSYLADVSRQPDGSLSLSPATVTSGFIASVKPLAVNADTGAIDTNVDIALTELAGFEPKVINGVEVQHPTIRNRLSSRNDAPASADGSRTVALVRGAAPAMVAKGDDGTEVFVSLK